MRICTIELIGNEDQKENYKKKNAKKKMQQMFIYLIRIKLKALIDKTKQLSS